MKKIVGKRKRIQPRKYSKQIKNIKVSSYSGQGVDYEPWGMEKTIRSRLLNRMIDYFIYFKLHSNWFHTTCLPSRWFDDRKLLVLGIFNLHKIKYQFSNCHTWALDYWWSFPTFGIKRTSQKTRSIASSNSMYLNRVLP